MLLQEIFKSLSKKTEPYKVGQKLKSCKSRNVILLKREVYVSGIKHFTFSIENEPWKNTELLSEHGLREKEYLPFK